MTVPPVEIASGFPPGSREQWRTLALKVLQKSGVLGEDAGPAAVEEALSSTTHDGVTIAPLYDAADLPAAPRIVRPDTGGTSGSVTQIPIPP